MKTKMPAAIASLLSGMLTVTTPVATGAQDCPPRPDRLRSRAEPPGRDLFVPFVPTPGSPVAEQLRAVEQLKKLAEMNRLTVELVKRRSDPNLHRTDTPQLIKRLQRLAKELSDGD